LDTTTAIITFYIERVWSEVAKKYLIIIPGLGDRKWLYSFVKPIWVLLGFKTHVLKYGWNSDVTESCVAQQSLVDFIDTIHSNNVYIIGVSAGGMAAVNTLTSSSSKVMKVATICSPYSPIPGLNNQLIISSSSQLQLSLQTMSQDVKNKILAIYSRYDQVVSVQYCRPLGIKTKVIRIIGHGPSIVFSLTVLSQFIKHFFLKS